MLSIVPNQYIFNIYFLGVKESRRNHLRHLLGIDLMAKVKTEAKKSVSRLTKEFKDFLNTSSNASENNNSTAKD